METDAIPGTTSAASPEASDDQLSEAVANRELKQISYELFILGVSLLSMLNVVIVLLPVEGPVEQVALAVEALLAPVFLLDFLYRLGTARSRRAYFVRHWGWADLLSAVPLFGIFRIFRVVRVLRLLRTMDVDTLAREVYVTRAQTTFCATMLLVVLVVEFAGIAVFYAERGASDANITSGTDAVWWGLVTITTVGYGDQFPVTDAGRIVGTVLLFAGVGLFSVLTGFIANAFLAPRPPRVKRIRSALTGMEGQIADLRDLLIEQEQRAADVRSRLDELERTLHAQARAREDRSRGDPGGPAPRS